jgi:hypothetical protein
VIGVPISISKVLSTYTVNLTLILTSIPPNCLIKSEVFSLNSFVNCPILTPLAQSIGPRGGVGVAFPAGTSIFKIFCTLAILINKTK